MTDVMAPITWAIIEISSMIVDWLFDAGCCGTDIGAMLISTIAAMPIHLLG
jgi:hypothetical protein